MICAMEQFENNRYSVNVVLKRLKMTISTIIMVIYDDIIYNGLVIITFNSNYIKGPEKIEL